ncbi:Gfo/Idh/MocA family protein [Anaerocolumna sp. MB42-C2]|uniref:Gfo/Idh/MocA family protein n=1 Tax=Anaerocolumna sp. MB42-C2 TaxID=3070997 RepID=UPI0027DEB5DC|nr:Gfo/Idh/MocA family oxidoreductase [Anaerocolumna sp. MB42-C2]WMJ85356.1 Gfo/Idh/MocA family oxidoreductase [Anaerocolumna sp. MB42-C2]
MIRIGFVDRYLDNWHTNHYPEYIQLAAELYGIDARVTHVYAQMDTPDEYGLTTKAWCEQYECICCITYEELIESVDAIMVMCADDCLPHEELAEKALKSGKPVYCDKTFAPTMEAAARMFDLAKQYYTPVFTCSAQRFCMELLTYKRQQPEPVDFCGSTGPGDMVNYSIHQYEMLEVLMGIGAKRCQAFAGGDTVHILYQYDNGRTCTFTQGKKLPFRIFASAGTEGCKDIAVEEYYMNFMNKLLHFFQDKKAPVTREDTMEIMAMQQAGREAVITPGVWIEV